MSYRTTVIELLSILQREGGYRAPVDQVAIAKARTLVAAAVLPITVVVCNMPLCPARLELAGDLSEEAARVELERMLWWSDGHRHFCVSCDLRGGH